VKFGKQLPKTEELLETVRSKAGSSDDCVYVRAIQFQFCETFGRRRECFRHHEFPRRHPAISGALAFEECGRITLVRVAFRLCRLRARESEKGFESSLVDGAQGVEIRLPWLSGSNDVLASPRKNGAPAFRREDVGDQARVPSVPVWKCMNHH